MVHAINWWWLSVRCFRLPPPSTSALVQARLANTSQESFHLHTLLRTVLEDGRHDDRRPRLHSCLRLPLHPQGSRRVQPYRGSRVAPPLRHLRRSSLQLPRGECTRKTPTDHFTRARVKRRLRSRRSDDHSLFHRRGVQPSNTSDDDLIDSIRI